ncbi:hypothetical protein EYF80_022284 [Liparis tanakae]|uniref:Uncharacterized protein n=1 Tax=Liparis tanakae TaxID=230148 RepID=A0A4Z2HNS0_9TELE|nr:hypothetical protein EYF80_022284 [Liparis tanakae]
MKTLLLASALFAGLFGSLAAAPAPGPAPGPDPSTSHAYCRTTWHFETPCGDISNTLAKQIQDSSPEYKLVIFTPSYIKANHTSDIPEGEDIGLAFNPTLMTKECCVTAMSTSFGFTSRLDDGLNYCNLYNLLLASDLNSSPGFKETTNKWACPGYALATCKAWRAFILK